MDIPAAALDALIENALREDIGIGDVTTNTVIPPSALLSAHLVAREELVLAGIKVVERIFKTVDPTLAIHALENDGAHVTSGTRLMTIKGRARNILTAERTALNLLQLLSGIATLTHQYVKAIDGTGVQLLDTRKTIPGLRLLSKYATRMGGAVNHRTGLYDGILVKDNHLANITITDAVTQLRAASSLPIQIECDTAAQVDEAIAAGADKILLDNMAPDQMKEIITKHKGKATFEASGGVTLQTIRAIAETGVDYISVGRLTHSAPAVDIGLDF